MYIQALYIYWFTTHDKHDCIYNYHSFILQKRRPSHKRDAQAGFKPRLSGCIVLALHHGAPRELSRVLFPHPQPPSLYQQKQISEDHPIQVLKRTWVDISTWKNHFYSFFHLISKGSGGFFFFFCLQNSVRQKHWSLCPERGREGGAGHFSGGIQSSFKCQLKIFWYCRSRSGNNARHWYQVSSQTPDTHQTLSLPKDCHF